MKNYVELSGKVYNPEIRTTSSGKQVIRFGLSVWAGKDQDGKSVYHFINCKYWGDGIQSGMNIDILGKIAFDTWEKDGKQQTRVCILVNEYQDQNQNAPEQPQQEEIGW